ncbi:MAG TPA: DMT family transporter [Firmicutes bacterium]|jgi:drug/metabolite transporter (DMT)-like permease|nr:DMT family transporter [Bacillota bacterium]
MPQILADGLLLLVTVIWGTTFVLVKEAISSVKPFTFLAVRFFIGGLSLVLWLVVRRVLPSLRAQARVSRAQAQAPDNGAGEACPCLSGDVQAGDNTRKRFLMGSAVTGVTLLLAYATQTFGLLTVAAGKAAFITGLSVVMVPIASAFLLKTVPDRSTVAGVILATIGLGLMSLTFPFRIEPGDLLVFLCAMGFAAHILLVGIYARDNDPLVFAAIQLMVVAVGSFGAALLLEQPLSVPKESWGAIVYTATIATALTVLIQSAVQKYTSSTHTALIFSAEPVFGAFFAWIMLGEVLSSREMLGAVFILAGMLVSEIDP